MLSRSPALRASVLLPAPFRSCKLHDRHRDKKTRRHHVCAVHKSDLDELEMYIAVTNEKMMAAAKEERFQDAAEMRDKLEELRLRHRILQVKHTDDSRASICHPLGQVIQHRRFDYLGVIFGVHATCQAEEAWIRTMHVDRLPLGPHQPFYQVLVDQRSRSGGMVTYVAQENIAIPDQEFDEDPVKHDLVNQFFDGFDKKLKKYKPRQSVIDQYPDCLEARENAASQEKD